MAPLMIAAPKAVRANQKLERSIRVRAQGNDPDARGLKRPGKAQGTTLRGGSCAEEGRRPLGVGGRDYRKKTGRTTWRPGPRASYRPSVRRSEDSEAAASSRLQESDSTRRRPRSPAPC